ncbi:hypothetical protein EDD15DRAFT_2200418 [Pisolithus albus]|nr:hypothetical protein EDD15DRAFT_2200418 [Pisolithus albus]
MEPRVHVSSRTSTSGAMLYEYDPEILTESSGRSGYSYDLEPSWSFSPTVLAWSHYGSLSSHSNPSASNGFSANPAQCKIRLNEATVLVTGNNWDVYLRWCPLPNSHIWQSQVVATNE